MFDYMTTEEVVEMAERVGRITARDSGGLVEADDAAAEVLANVADWADQLKDKGPGYLYTAMKRSANKYAAKLRYERMVSSSAYLYTPREVRALLSEAFFDPDAWDTPSAKDDFLTASISKGTIGVSLMDLKTAFLELSEKQRLQLWRRFAEGQDTDGSPAVAVSRAIAALTRRMNTAANRVDMNHQGPGSPGRSRMSAEQGQKAAEGDYAVRGGAASQVDAQASLTRLRNGEPNKPAGTYFNWNKGEAA